MSSVLRVKAMLLRVKPSVLSVKPFVLRVKRFQIYNLICSLWPKGSFIQCFTCKTLVFTRKHLLLRVKQYIKI